MRRGLRAAALAGAMFSLLRPGEVFAQTSRKYFYEDIFTPFFVRDDAAGVYREQRPGSSSIAEQSQFPIRKDAGAFRVFVIGGSIAARYMSGPDNLGSVLRRVLPGKKIEVLNCGMGGYDSYREDMILEEVLGYQPDLIVLLTGHNERVGSPPVPLWLLRARDRIGRWATSVAAVQRFSRSNAEEFRFTPENMSRRDRAFRANLRDMLRRASRKGVPIAVALPPLNYRQSPPPMPLALQSTATARGWLSYLNGDARAAAALWRGDAAGSLYLRGLAEENLQDWGEALRDFSASADADRPTGRCAQKCRDAIREANDQDGGVSVDLDGAFRRVVAPRAPGLDMFDDGVHWRHRYDLLVSLEIVRALRSREPFRSWKWDDERAEKLDRRSRLRPGSINADEDLATLRYALSEMDQPEARLNWRAVVYLESVAEHFPRWFEDRAALLRRAEAGSGATGSGWGMAEIKTPLAVLDWYIGEARVRRKEFARAIDDFKKAQALDPQLPGVLLSLGVAQELSGDAVGAERTLARARRDPEDTKEAGALIEAMGFPDEEKLHAEAMSAQERGDARKSEAILRRLAKIFPDDPRYLSDLGVAAFLGGRLQESEDSFKAALRLAPEDLSAWSSLSAVYRAQGNFEEADRVEKKVRDGICSRNPRPPSCALFVGGPAVLAR